MKVIQMDWEFIENNYPSYSSCNLVLQSDIIARHLDGELLAEDNPDDVRWIKSLGDEEDVIIYYNEVNNDLYNRALQSYKEMKESARKKEEPPRTHRIYLKRIGYAYTHIDIQANTREEAEILAMDMAGDLDYSEKDSDYQIDDF